jgi:hypothetical protein
MDGVDEDYCEKLEFYGLDIDLFANDIIFLQNDIDYQSYKTL